MKSQSTSENCYTDADIISNEDQPQKIESNMNTLEDETEEEIPHQDNLHKDSLNIDATDFILSILVHRKPNRYRAVQLWA